MAKPCAPGQSNYPPLLFTIWNPLERSIVRQLEQLGAKKEERVPFLFKLKSRAVWCTLVTRVSKVDFPILGAGAPARPRRKLRSSLRHSGLLPMQVERWADDPRWYSQPCPNCAFLIRVVWDSLLIGSRFHTVPRWHGRTTSLGGTLFMDMKNGQVTSHSTHGMSCFARYCLGHNLCFFFFLNWNITIPIRLKMHHSQPSLAIVNQPLPTTGGTSHRHKRLSCDHYFET